MKNQIFKREVVCLRNNEKVMKQMNSFIGF